MPKATLLFFFGEGGRKRGRDKERGDGKRTYISINNVIKNVIEELNFNFMIG
jgi:hypothetical protein